jgi:dolichol-phosphate mannosyltransferase
MAESGKTLVTIATYNEIENLPTLVDEIFTSVPQVDMLIIDDGSPDGTGQWCDTRAAADPRFHCIHRSGKLGLGTAIVAGLKYALDKGYEFVVTMDADFSHHPRYLPDLIDGMNREGQGSVDVMVGSRYIPGGRIEGWPLKRHFMSRAINVYARTLLRLRTRDCSGGFRCYRTSRLARLDFDTMLSRGYSFQEELLWRLKQLGCRIDETPITFVDRVNGTSKIDMSEATAALRVLATLGASSLISKR